MPRRRTPAPRPGIHAGRIDAVCAVRVKPATHAGHSTLVRFFAVSHDGRRELLGRPFLYANFGAARRLPVARRRPHRRDARGRLRAAVRARRARRTAVRPATSPGSPTVAQGTGRVVERRRARLVGERPRGRRDRRGGVRGHPPARHLSRRSGVVRPDARHHARSERHRLRALAVRPRVRGRLSSACQDSRVDHDDAVVVGEEQVARAAERAARSRRGRPTVPSPFFSERRGLEASAITPNLSVSSTDVSRTQP